MPRITAEPTILSISDEPGIQGYIERFSTAVTERPALFATALEKLGGAATADTVELSTLEYATPHLAVSEEDLIWTYFTYRYDRYVEYDEATEKGMGRDEAYQEQLAQHLKTQTTKVMTGKMTSINRATSDAGENRNAARRASLGYFIGRAIQWQGQQENGKRLPSAG